MDLIAISRIDSSVQRVTMALGGNSHDTILRLTVTADNSLIFESRMSPDLHRLLLSLLDLVSFFRGRNIFGGEIDLSSMQCVMVAMEMASIIIATRTMAYATCKHRLSSTTSLVLAISELSTLKTRA